MQNVVFTCLLVVILLCSSCLVSFKNPLPDLQKIDNSLLGKWKPIGKEKVIFEFSSDSDSQTVLKLIDEVDSTERVVLSATSVKLNNRNFLSLKLLNEEGEGTFLIAKYEIENDKMRVWLLNKTQISKIIDTDELEGERKSGGEISISASSEEISKLLTSPENDELFQDLGTFKKQ